MRELHRQIDAVIVQRELPWTRLGPEITVRFQLQGRSQKILLTRNGSWYEFTSKVLAYTQVTASYRRWRDLAYRAWRKNALKELVCFAFDHQDNLIGLVRQPAATMDPEELILAIETLAIECDRFEYVISGSDRE